MAGKVGVAQKKVLQVPQIAEETLDPSCGTEPTPQQDTTEANGHAKDHFKLDKNSRWKRKIQATFPLFFVKHFQRSTADKDETVTIPEVDSEFEDIQTDSHGTSKDVKCEKRSTPDIPKKRLTISVTEKEKLLDWNMPITPLEETPAQLHTDNKTAKQAKDQVQAEPATEKPQANLSQDQEPTPSSTSTFQLISSFLKRSFGTANPSTSSQVTMRTRPNGLHKQRPMSEGAFSFSSRFDTAGLMEPSIEEEPQGDNTLLASVGSDVRESGQDLASILQQVSLAGRRGSEGVFSNSEAFLPRRRVNFFSSLRLRKREASETEGEKEGQKEIRTILTNLRNKASSQRSLDLQSSSSDEEDGHPPTNNKVISSQRQKRKLEKTVAQEAKRGQLKRLHKAQTIQRQLEEVGEKQRDLEERGVVIEKMLRGETDESQSDDIEEAQLYQSWFKLVLQKNRLARYESELVIFAQELELEDTQCQLQQDLRRRMAVEDTKKSASELQEEQEILSKLMKTVEKRDTLVSELDEQRLKERAEDRDLDSLVFSKGYEFHWAQEGGSSWDLVDTGI